MKKLLSVLLCVLMVTMLVPSAMAAADKCADTLSDTVWNFSESDDVSFYGFANNQTDDYKAVIDPTGGPDGSPALSLARGTNNNIYIDFVHNGYNIVQAEAVEVKYSFYVTGSDAMQKLVFKNGDDNIVLKFQKQHITFLGQQVATNAYVKNTWYDVEVLIDITQGYGRLKFKANTADTWNVYHVLASGTEMANGGLKGMTMTNRIGIGLQESSATLYIDNYYQNYATNVKPALLDADDFSSGISSYTQTNVATGITAETVELNGNQVLKISTDGTNAGKNTNLAKQISATSIAGALANTNYIFKFKFGGTCNGSQIGATLGLSSGKEYFLVNIINGYLNMFGEITVPTNEKNQNFQSAFGAIEADTLYDAEAAYNPTTGELRVAATNASGKQVFGKTTVEGNPTKFAFRLHSAANSASTAYFDDFETGVLTGAPEFVSSTVASGDTAAASLDETVIFTYDRTILQSELAAAAVKLNDEALTNDVDYTITSKGNQVMVTLKDLAKDTDYTVALTGVKDLAEAATEEAATAVFHTAVKDIEAEKPVLNSTTLSATVKSWYAQGKKVKLIAALYNAEGTKLVNVAVKEFTVDDRNGETISYDFSDVFNAEGKKMGFVWSDFDTMIPYAAAYSD